MNRRLFDSIEREVQLEDIHTVHTEKSEGRPVGVGGDKNRDFFRRQRAGFGHTGDLQRGVG